MSTRYLVLELVDDIPDGSPLLTNLLDHHKGKITWLLLGQESDSVIEMGRGDVLPVRNPIEVIPWNPGSSPYRQVYVTKVKEDT